MTIDRNLKELINRVERDGASYSAPIDRDELLAWMSSEDIELQGALHAMLSLENVRAAVCPTLEFHDYFDFASSYLLRCLASDARGDWASSRYEAGWELCRWFIQLWDDNGIDRSRLRELKDRLAKVYRSGDVELRTAIETSILEHLFEDRRIADFFDDWREMEPLATAYSAAKLWVDRGGTSTFHDSRRMR